jgi:hypothetical protein
MILKRHRLTPVAIQNNQASVRVCSNGTTPEQYAWGWGSTPRDDDH